MATASSGGSLIGRIGSYLQIVAKDPSSTAFVPLAEAYRQTGLMDDALEAARLGTQRLPHFSPGFSTLGRILGQMGRLDEAMSAYARALSIDRQSQAALVGLARLHLIRGERDLARKILNQAMEFHPDDEKIADMLNALDLPRPWADIQQAAQVQEPAEVKSPEAEVSAEPIPTATLAEIYVKQGLVDKAIKTYQEILEQNPDNAKARERILQLQQGTAEAPVVEAPVAEAPVAEAPVAEAPVAEAPVAEAPGAKTDVDVAADKNAGEPPVAPVETQQVSDEPKDQSALGILQRWLAVIKQGRDNV